MGKCKIFTNSVSDLRPELAREHNVSIVPDAVLFGERVYMAPLEIDPPKLYRLLRENDALPTTSHPNIGEYSASFRSAQAYEEILCINVSSQMSGSIGTANAAAQALAEEGFGTRIFTYDSLQASLGLAYLVLKAADKAEEGASAQEIITYLDSIRDRVGVYFCLKSLENARKGGRISEVRCMAADLLGIRPVLMLRGGVVKDVNLVRSYEKAMLRAADYYARQATKGGRVIVCHADNEPAAHRLKEMVLEIDGGAQVMIEWIGAAVGIHTGEGAVGIIFGE